MTAAGMHDELPGTVACGVCDGLGAFPTYGQADPGCDACDSTGVDVWATFDQQAQS